MGYFAPPGNFTILPILPKVCGVSCPSLSEDWHDNNEH